MNKNLDVVEDIKHNIQDNQCKTIMDSFMEVTKINNNDNKSTLLSKNQEHYKLFYSFNW